MTLEHPTLNEAAKHEGGGVHGPGGGYSRLRLRLQSAMAELGQWSGWRRVGCTHLFDVAA